MSAGPEAKGIDRLGESLAKLDSSGTIEEFLISVGGEILRVTGASACGITRRFSGAGRDLVILVLTSGEPMLRVTPLSRNQRYERLSVPGTGKWLGEFNNPQLAAMAREAGERPGRVLAIPVVYGSRPVVDIEIADPRPECVPEPEPLIAAVNSVAPVFKLAVLQERLRRERLEARMLLEVGKELGRTLDLKDLVSSILDLLAQIVPFDAAAIYVLDREGLAAVHHSLRGYEENQQGIVHLKLNQGIVGWAARTGEPEIVSDVKKDARYLLARPETRSEMVVPLKTGGRVIGVFNLENNRLAAYNLHDLELLETFAGQTGAVLERARLLEEEQSKQRLDQELVIARRIQQSFLPPPNPTLEQRGLAGTSISSEEVSGDYFDFLERPDGSVAVAIADVSGKGIPAALIMSSLRTAFRLGALGEMDAEKLCRDLNIYLYGSLGETEFVTGVFGFLDPEFNWFYYCNAGHNPPVLVRKTGDVEFLETGGMILGILPDQPYPAGRIRIAPGDVLVMYTDGVTEAHPGNYEEFGEERFTGVVRGVVNESPAVICQKLVESVREFVDGPLPDDLTLVVIKHPQESAS